MRITATFSRANLTGIGRVEKPVDTAEIYALLPCGQLSLEPVVAPQINEFKAVLIARLHAFSTSRLRRGTQYSASIPSDKIFRCISSFTELHGHGGER